MNRHASSVATPRSIDQYLQQLRSQLAGEDAALIQDALYDAEEYLRAEVAAHPEKSQADVLELIAATYGAPEEVAAAYRDTEARVKAAMKLPTRQKPRSWVGRFFSIFSDPRAYASLFFMILSLATGIMYFTFTVAGIALSAGFAILIIGVPFFLLFIGVARVVSLAEGRLIEAVTGERMPRRPLHPGTAGFWARVAQMLKDWRTWSTLVYLALMLPLGIAYFTAAIAGLAVSLALIVAPLFEAGRRLGWIQVSGSTYIEPSWLASPWLLCLSVLSGIILLTLLMHVARGVGYVHARYAKTLLVSAAGPS